MCKGAPLLRDLKPSMLWGQLPFHLEMRCFQKYRYQTYQIIFDYSFGRFLWFSTFSTFIEWPFSCQNTVKEPAKKNLYKGVSAAYTVIILTYWQLAFCGYWAFGSEVQPYILASLTVPEWTIVMANLFAVIQISGCYQVIFITLLWPGWLNLA